MLLKLDFYGDRNRIQFCRRLKREAQRNVEPMWRTGRQTSKRMAQIVESFNRCLAAMDCAERTLSECVEAMAATGREAGMVGYDVQIAFDYKHHLIVAREVTNVAPARRYFGNMNCTCKRNCQLAASSGCTTL